MLKTLNEWLIWRLLVSFLAGTAGLLVILFIIAVIVNFPGIVGAGIVCTFLVVVMTSIAYEMIYDD